MKYPSGVIPVELTDSTPRLPLAYSWLTAWVLICAFASPPAQAQVITTVAGADWSFPTRSLPAVGAPLSEVTGVAVDKASNIYISDGVSNLVMRISPDGTLTVIAGNGIRGFSGDGGPATGASLYEPTALALDSVGNLYITDRRNQRIRMVTPLGTITTIAGNGVPGYGGDGGPATSARLNYPDGVTADSSGQVYIADFFNNRIRKVSGGTITTVVGNGGNGSSGDGGPAINATIQQPTGVALDTAGILYISSYHTIRKVAGGTITTVATGDIDPNGVTVDGNGNIYTTDSPHVYEISGGRVIKIAGSDSTPSLGGFSGDGGPATDALLSRLEKRLAVDAAGNVYVADSINGRLRKISGGIITTIAGNGVSHFFGDGGLATSAVLSLNSSGPFPSYGGAVTVDRSGALYIADTFNQRVRRVSGGLISTVAGSGGTANGFFSGDGGPATDARLNDPLGLAVDSAGNLYVTDNNRIRKISGGIIATVAGNGNFDFSGDGGAATSASLRIPQGVAVDSAGNVYITDSVNNRIRKVSGGIITTVAGNGTFGFSGDGGPATSASLGRPQGVAVDSAGNLYIADAYNYRIRKVSNGIITTVAGNGISGFSGDGGLAITAQMWFVTGVAVDSVGNLYIADSFNNRIRKVSNGIITTVAGNGISGFSGDGGLATSASLNGAQYAAELGVAVDFDGNLYIVDAGNDRIRKVLATPPTVQISGASLSFSGQSTGAPAPPQSFSIASVPGLRFSLTVATTTGSNWLSVTPPSGAAPRLIDVVADPSKVTSPGTYQGTITIATPDANPPSTTVSVTFTVAAAQPPALAPLDPRNFSFSFAKSTPAQGQNLTISNAGGGTLSFTAATTISTPAGARWLTLSQTSGQATPGSPAILTVTADPTGLGTGTFTGTVSVTAGATTLSVPVTITVSALDQAILLSQRGLFFTAVAQGGVIPPQTFAVRNIGAGVVAWTAKPVPPSPINGVVSAVPWLRVSPSSGTTDASLSPPTVTVTVDPSKLGQGTYYGLVEVDAPTAANRSQVLTVVLQVLKAGSNVGAALTPGSLLFSTSAGASSPGSQNVLAYNITANAKSFRSVASADPGLALVILPTNATLDPQNPTSIVVQPFTTALGPGVYTGIVTLQFDDGRVLRLTVKVIVAKPGGASSAVISRTAARAGAPADATCTPTKLQPILTAPNDAFEAYTGFGIKLGVFVKDDCGVALQSGSVKVSFSNGDTTSTLKHLQGGLWEGSWYTHNPSASVNLKVHAENPPLGISGDLQTNGSLASQQPPAFDEAGISSVFGGATFAPLAPGEVISIYGSGLAETSLAASGFPLTTTLVDTTVTIQGKTLPLYYVGEQQVNAVVPYSLSNTSLNAPLQILVQRGNTLSQPVYVTVATAVPTTYSGANGVTAYPASGGSPYIVTPATPAHAGDTIVIYCLGLGAVTPPVADGGLPTGISNAAAVQMLIGDQPANVIFAGLQGQFPGLYQVNTVIPAGVTRGSSVPVTITSGGQTSPAIQIPIQ